MAMTTARPHRPLSPVSEPPGVRWALIGLGVAFMGLFLVWPLAAVFSEALRQGLCAYLDALRQPDAQAAIRLTLLIAAIAVPLNVVFGVCASWAIAKFEFKGKAFLTTLIDLPFSVSPVISGLVYVLLFGSGSLLGPWLRANGIE